MKFYSYHTKEPSVHRRTKEAVETSSKIEFLNQCIALCLERLDAEKVATECYDEVHITYVTSGMVVCQLINERQRNQIAFQVFYEGTSKDGTALYAVPVINREGEEQRTNTVREAILPTFALV